LTGFFIGKKMISSKNRLVNQLLRYIYRDKKDVTMLRVDIDNVTRILEVHGYNIPRNKFEVNVEKLLNTKLVGAKINPGTSAIIADLIIDLADKMHISDEALANYFITHNTEQDAVETQNKIKEWRKEYYGSMDKTKKQALLESLEGKINNNVLDQIRRA